jgi:hypothetical protein
MLTAIIIAIALFLLVLCFYIIRNWFEYKKNPAKVKEFVKNNFNHDISKESIEQSQAKKFAPKNNRRTTRGRRWQYIDSACLHEGTRKVYHHAHV